MFKAEVKVNSKNGFHARPASRIVKFLEKYPNDIKFIKSEKVINPKSILGILSSQLKYEDKFVLEVDGENADEVGNQIVSFINSIED